MSAARKAQHIANEAEAFFNAKESGQPVGSIFIPSPAFNGLTGLTTNQRLLVQTEEQAFPAVRAGLRPTGSRVLVQLRVPVGSTESGALIIDTESRKTELDNTTVCKVVATGPMAFKHRSTGENWPEGSWCEPGYYVRIPKYVGDRFVRKYLRDQMVFDHERDRPRTEKVEDNVVFVLVNDLDISAVYESVDDAIGERAFL